ncbi:hypothetical protein ACFL96_19805 [Thermoproteota archaeon]
MIDTLAVASSILTLLFYRIFINIVVPVIIFLELRKKGQEIWKALIIVLSLIVCCWVVSSIAVWVLSNVMSFNFLTALIIIPASFFLVKKRYFLAILSCKLAELAVIIMGLAFYYPIH